LFDFNAAFDMIYHAGTGQQAGRLRFVIRSESGRYMTAGRLGIMNREKLGNRT
jgi:hypothetical protein